MPRVGTAIADHGSCRAEGSIARCDVESALVPEPASSAADGLEPDRELRQTRLSGEYMAQAAQGAPG